MKSTSIDVYKLKLILFGIIVGIFSGAVVSSFRWSIGQLLKLFQGFYVSARTSLITGVLVLICLIVVGIIVSLMLKKEPNISGSGIPQVEAQLDGELEVKWWSVLWRKFVGGIISIGPGLFLGREGPAIQLGASVGQGVGELGRLDSPVSKRILIASGAAGGLAAAFNAPLAGSMFVLEEIYHNFSPMVWITALASSVSSNLVALYVFGLTPVLNIPYKFSLPINMYWHLLVLGIILGLLGRLYQVVLLEMPSIFAKTKIPRSFQGLIPLILLLPIGMMFPKYIGGGNGLIVSLSNMKVGLLVLIGILVLRFVFSMISYGSGLPGGIFLPILNLGAVIGAVYAVFMHQIGFLPLSFESNLIIFAMAGYFACISKAPFTAIILVTEMVGSLGHLMPLVVISLVAYIVVDIMNGSPIYEALKEKLTVNKKYLNRVSKFNDRVEIPVFEGSPIDGKYIRDINFPQSVLVISIYRGEMQIIPRGDTLVKSGDRIVMMVNGATRAVLKKKLTDLINGID
ncbi:ClC family H(+)/Cl(-) exchange transporter [Companilactobacillus zhongbaensis]|uniref:ClC family H(+)/Cl(-) exchange transporter n=1 Tax=Companilactobacillus zhongbaensis TaxID=2486009 RepID=UPI000F773ED4|nr:ClC family H(+)/Cl(-) exchange transporter [Companilactobacillus zhongbaensis]